MPWLNVQGQAIFYAARGSELSVPLVFVYGAGASHLIWNAQLAALADTARVLAVDLPGHGRSLGAGRRAIKEYAQVIRELLDALALERAIVVGHSMGGAIAQTLALDVPERVRGLGLVGTGARLRVLPEFLEGLRADFFNTAQRINEYSFAPDADAELKQLSLEQLLKCEPQVAHDDYAACDKFDVMGRLGEIRAPTLVLCGAADRMTPVKYSEYLASHIAGAQLQIISGAGHNLMLEQPLAVNRALREWITQLS